MMDFGCGEGQGMRLVGEVALGCDLSIDLLRRNSHEGRVARTRLPDLRWLKSDCLDLGYSVYLLDLIEDHERFFKEAARVVKREGALVCCHQSSRLHITRLCTVCRRFRRSPMALGKLLQSWIIDRTCRRWRGQVLPPAAVGSVERCGPLRLDARRDDRARIESSYDRSTPRATRARNTSRACSAFAGCSHSAAQRDSTPRSTLLTCSLGLLRHPFLMAPACTSSGTLTVVRSMSERRSRSGSGQRTISRAICSLVRG